MSSYLRRLFSAITLLFFAVSAVAVTAQRAPSAPRQDRLLNGLKILLWNVPGSDRVELKLRIHSGAAFDPQEKEGVMKLISQSFFPTAESREFFTEELGGGLNVECTYDMIQVSASARSDQFLPLLETVAQAVVNSDVGKEAASSLKSSLAAELDKLETSTSYIADRAVSKRLYGTFPYGRPVYGDKASLEKIDFADLRFARDRLVTADNSTLAIRGPIDAALASKAVRRFFGSWAKSDRTIPSTFRQPDPPQPEVYRIEVRDLANSEIRHAVRGFARSSKEFAAAEVLSKVMKDRLQQLSTPDDRPAASVAHEEHLLPGAFVVRYRSSPAQPKLIGRAGLGDSKPFEALAAPPVTESEFAKAKADAIAELAARDPMDHWLDIDTFRIASVADDTRSFHGLTLSEVNALAARLSAQPVATAVVVAASPQGSN